MKIQEAILEAVKSHVYIPLKHKEMHSSLCSDLVQRKEFLHSSLTTRWVDDLQYLD